MVKIKSSLDSMKKINTFLFQEKYQSPLSKNIQNEFNKFVLLVESISNKERKRKQIEGTGGRVSISDIIAYQIGWGNLLLTWYKAGICGKLPEMPGEGFKNWDYVRLAKLFYKKYHYDGDSEQIYELYSIVKKILLIV